MLTSGSGTTSFSTHLAAASVIATHAAHVEARTQDPSNNSGQMLHNGVVVSGAFNEDAEDQERATVTGNAILYLQIGDQVSMLILYH